MNRIHYLPLYSKAYASRRGIILQDKKAEQLWLHAKMKLHGKAADKWNAYYAAMRAKVFDDWLADALLAYPKATVLHLGCGLDSRCERVPHNGSVWIDLDLVDVIEERRKHYEAHEGYRMIAADALRTEWLNTVKGGENAIVLMEGLSMYLPRKGLRMLLEALQKKFQRVAVLLDCYTVYAARTTRQAGPHGENIMAGYDKPTEIEWNDGIHFVEELCMTPPHLIEQLPRVEQDYFAMRYGERAVSGVYHLFSYVLQPSGAEQAALPQKSSLIWTWKTAV